MISLQRSRFAKALAALIVAFAILIGIVTTSHADADYHRLDTFALTEISAGYNVTAFDIAPSGNLDGGLFFEQKVSSLWSVALVSVLLQWHRQRYESTQLGRHHLWQYHGRT